MVDLRAEWQELISSHGSNAPETRPVRAQINNFVTRRSHLRLQSRRKAYFEHVDRMRALGQPIDPEILRGTCQTDPRPRPNVNPDFGAPHLGSFLHDEDLGGDRRRHYFVEMLVEYLSYRYSSVEATVRDLVAESTGSRPPPRPMDLNLEKRSRCLFGCASLAGRTKFDVHFASFHKKSVESPFLCPECRLEGRKAPVIDGMVEWSVHTERVHGKLHSPKPRAPERLRDRGPRTYERPPRVPCLLCWTLCCVGQGYSRHFNKAHKFNDFNEPFPCPACRRLGLGQNVMIDGIRAWGEHARDIHCVDAQRGVSTLESGAPKVITQRGRGKILKRIATHSGGARFPYNKRPPPSPSEMTKSSLGNYETLKVDAGGVQLL